MKNQTIFNLIFLFSLIAQTVFGQSNISVFSKPIQLDVPLTVGEYATGYPLSIEAEHLKSCAAKHVSTACISAVFDAVKNELGQGNLPEGVPVFGAFFTTQYDNDVFSINREKTHGFCFAFQRDKTLTLKYYERNQSGMFDPIEKLTSRINSYTEELFISLHYSHFSPGSYPDNSTIFSFTCDTLGKVTYIDSSDVFTALSRDYKRQTGLFPLGMADSSILSSLDHPNGGESNCGNDCNITQKNTHCLVVTDGWGTTTYSCVNSIGRCAAGAMDKKARDGNINLGVPIKFKMMRDFRDKFMTKYCEGRKYIGFYYTFSKYSKMSISLLWKYASLLPELYAAMENLTDETTNKVVFTPSFREKTLEILHEHKDVGDSYFQSILSEVERDLENFTGLKRSDVISMLSTYGNCHDERISLPGQTESHLFITAAYVNSSGNEIVVNYSVPGSRIKLELFSASTGLIASAESRYSSGKIVFPSSSLEPGIYIYRLISDSGYEKTGKVALIK